MVLQSMKSSRLGEKNLEWGFDFKWLQIY